MIVVNFSTKEYLRPQRRLIESLNGYRYLMFDSYEAIGSPTHQASPYEFKIHAIERAFEFDDIVLWCDSSLWRVGDLSVIENIIKEEGFFGTEAGHYAGRWTNKHTQKYFNVTEEEMQQGPGGIVLFSAGLLGLNKKNETAMKFLSEWKASALAGCFSGDWAEHRHDQSCASIIASRLGFKFQRGGKYMSYIGPGYSQPEESSIFYLQGMA
jgi:hypothetical protein